jgi:hypothetical protein
MFSYQEIIATYTHFISGVKYIHNPKMFFENNLKKDPLLLIFISILCSLVLIFSMQVVLVAPIQKGIFLIATIYLLSSLQFSPTFFMIYIYEKTSIYIKILLSLYSSSVYCSVGFIIEYYAALDPPIRT